MAGSGESEEDEYILNRSYAASARLNLQHYLWLDNANFQLLHPAIPLEDPHLKIADVGTGTGIWLLAVARQVPPTAQLDGLDISLDQVPPREWLPPNVNFRRHDVYEPPSLDFEARYDIIHVRHLLLVVRENDPAPVLRNLLQMLKPGGYLQWGEFNLSNRLAMRCQPDRSMVEMKGLSQRIREFLPEPLISWPGELDGMFEREKLENISFIRTRTEPYHFGFHMDVLLLAYEEMINVIASKPFTTQAEVNELRHRLVMTAKESRQGVAWNIEKLIAIGRKPG
ncbi:MAG: hypothetical protein Q9167_003035 [Letrouitia subvulpina]